MITPRLRRSRYQTSLTRSPHFGASKWWVVHYENAKSHIKQRIRRILPKLLNEKNEKCITKLIMADIIPDDVLEWLWKTANRENMSVVQAYLLEYMKKIQKKNYKNFSCKVVRINPLKAAGAKASAAFCGLTDTGNFASCFLFYKNPAY